MPPELQSAGPAHQVLAAQLRHLSDPLAVTVR
jgi:hypothetical protein